MLVAWAALLVAGLGASVWASGHALGSAVALGRRARLPAHIIGLTIVAIGTDLPEIANSISASAAGRGDLNVGDSTGSAATQITLVLGIICLLRPLRADRRFVAAAGFLTVAAFGLGAWMMSDGSLSRLNGAVLVLAWIGATAVVYRNTGVHAGTASALDPGADEDPAAADRTTGDGDPDGVSEDNAERGIAVLAGRTLLALGLVAAGAVVAVSAFGRLTDELGVPEYATSFLVLSIGTSLPELIVDGQAVLKGMGALALGDVIGSSLIDATLSLGIGPLLFPTDVSEAAARGTLLAGGIVALAVLLLLRRTEHRWFTGVSAIALYLMLYPIIIL